MALAVAVTKWYNIFLVGTSEVAALSSTVANRGDRSTPSVCRPTTLRSSSRRVSTVSTLLPPFPASAFSWFSRSDSSLRRLSMAV